MLVRELAAQGLITGASARNWASYGQDVDLRKHDPITQALFTDPQTSGGLLVSCAPGSVEAVLEIFRDEGFAHARVIGQMQEGPARVTLD
ncbi:MAG: hypothetical protein B7X42_04445 [Thiomonas sp. 14-66-4]|nr:MAG: hypothetical protein B7X42_04445 [Thiomonas sp. 14-66-4]